MGSPRHNPKKVSKAPLLRADEIESILEIGVALAAERDLDSLLYQILERSRKILTADAASIFLAEGVSPHEPTHLRFKMAQNESVQIEVNEFVFPIDPTSLAGYVAQTREAIALEDVYKISRELPVQFNPEVDRKTGYRSKSIISVPMSDHEDQLIGVVQLWNKKKERGAILTPENIDEIVIPFGETDYKLLASLTAQAGVAIENARLHKDIQQLFEGFILASVSAIEARDPTTSGHSERVATLTADLAEIVDRVDTGSYRKAHFSVEEMREIKYAALLHDFGKIGVREDVLQKAKKLYGHELANLKDRLNLLYRTIELEICEQKLSHLVAGGVVGDETWTAYESDFQLRIKQLERANEILLKSNEPTVLPEKVSQELRDLSDLLITRPDRSMTPLVSGDEIRRLSIPKGSLSPEERLEIESHVAHTYQFLSRIPWTRELRRVADIAHAHHEKLDGTGYPRRLRSHDIPLPSKIMTVTDIFDALVARDRPYKKALPVSKALGILTMEAEEKKLDPELVRLFIDTKVYELTTKS